MRENQREMEKIIKRLEERITAVERQLSEFRQTKNEPLWCSPFLKTLIQCVEKMDISKETFLGNSQKRGRLFFARCVFASKLYQYGYTVSDIGRLMNRTHSTVIHYVKCYKTVKDEPRFDKAFAAFITEFNNLLNQ